MDETVKQFPWMIGAVLTGFLISRRPPRRKVVYVLADSPRRKSPKEREPARPTNDHRQLMEKLWSLLKPIICTYIGREIYRRFRRQAGNK